MDANSASTTDRKSGMLTWRVVNRVGDCCDNSQIEAHEIHRGKGLEVCLSLALSTRKVTVRFSSAKFPEKTIDGETTYLHLHNFCIELKGREIFFSPQDFGPTDLTSTYSVCTRRVFGGIGHRTHAFRSGVRCSNHKATHFPTALFVLPLV
ncbi:hypothetical protein TNCV_3770991 [Trichonephila clavipes]|nr:hypothetical protein TNCV_3770991 [Trichonephila clavipes]